MTSNKLSGVTRSTLQGAKHKKKDVPWFFKAIPPRLMSPALIDLLEGYSNIPREEQEEHLLAVRDEAWEIFPMPCVGLFWWLALGLSTHPKYAELLSLLKTPSPPSPVKFLDLGTCMGQDTRKLIHDGVPAARVYGSDFFPQYERIGHSLFRDEDRMKGHFFPGDIHDDDPNTELVRSAGTWDAVSICMFLHLFSYEQQVVACKRILSLLKPIKGSMVIGIQSGNVDAGDEEMKIPFLESGTMITFRQNKETFRKMWEDVSRELEVEVTIWVEYIPRWELGETDVEQQLTAGHAIHDKGSSGQRRIYFCIERL